VPEVPGGLCMGHPAMCRALGDAARQAGATVLTGVESVEVTAGTPPSIAFSHTGSRVEWTPRLIVGADGRNSQVRHQLGFEVKADPPHNLLGGMLVDGVPGWPQDTAFGTEDRVHFLIFGQGGDRLRLYLCYGFADKQAYAGPQRQQTLIETFARLRCLPQADLIAASRPIGPFNSFSNEDHWVEDPTAPGIVLVGDAAGHNDPITGQGLAIALRDACLVGEIVALCRGEARAHAAPAYRRPVCGPAARRVRTGRPRPPRTCVGAHAPAHAVTAPGDPGRSGKGSRQLLRAKHDRRAGRSVNRVRPLVEKLRAFLRISS